MHILKTLEIKCSVLEPRTERENRWDVEFHIRRLKDDQLWRKFL